MTEDEIVKAINHKNPGIYTPATGLFKLTFFDNSIIVGYFDLTNKSYILKKENKYTFIECNNKQNYINTNDEKYVTIVDGKLLKEVEYPSFPK